MAQDCVGRDLQHLSGLFHTRPPEVAQFHDLPFRRSIGQSFERIVQLDQVLALFLRPHYGFVERYLGNTASALLVSARAGGIDRNLAHPLGEDREEVGAVLPVDLPGIQQAQVGFVDRRRGLQRAPWAFTVHVPARQAGQFHVDERN